MSVQLAAVQLADTWGMHDVGVGWGIVMMLLMIAFWGAVIWGVVWIVRGGAGHGPTSRGEDPLDVLDRRLADGSISSEEYTEKRRMLAHRAPGDALT